MKKILIPRREPQLIEREAKRRWHGDDEKVATTTTNPITVLGVVLESRYSKAHELGVMQNAVHLMPPDVRDEIVSIFCDSKCGASYIITVGTNTAPVTRIASEFHRIISDVGRGHNGFDLRMKGKNDSWGDVVLSQDPFWNDDCG